MPSKFPGMDPCLEGQRWRDFHHRVIGEMATALTSMLRPRYAADIEERVYLEHSPDEPARFYEPDVAVHRGQAARSPHHVGTGALLVEPEVVPLVMPEEVREAYLEVRSQESRELVAVIEVLSPKNKRPGSDGQRAYLEKRETVLRSSAHFIEIDLLRGGQRVALAIPTAPCDYRITVSRKADRPLAQVWSLSLTQRLPIIPIPLAGTDPDVHVDLQAVFDTVYDQAGYDYRLDYSRETVPPLEPGHREWAAGILAAG